MQLFAILPIKFFGGYSGEATPVPISNTEVKLSSADGTAWATVWESRTPPELILPLQKWRGFFFVLQVTFCCAIHLSN
jgi:hypothetical protein